MDPEARTGQEIDGRRARGERARAAVADALLSLLAEGDLSPAAPKIAQRAGVSQRLLYHHFADLEALFDAVARRQQERVAELVRAIPPDLPFEERLRRFLDQRVALLEAITPVRRAAILHEPTSLKLRQRLATFRALKRAQLETVFGAELQALGEEARAEAAAALGAAASWSGWESLRAHQGLDVAQARKALERALRALLAAPRS